MMIVDYCASQAPTHLKNQTYLVDQVKATIKSGTKCTSEQKLRSLRLLNLAIMKADSN